MESQRFSTKLLLLHPKQIVVSTTRGRKDFKNIKVLVDSIQQYGLIHPCLVAKSEEEGKYKLIAGERRYRAMCILGWSQLPCTDRDDLSTLEQKEVELEENLKRENLSWEEEIELYRQIDEIKRKVHGSKMQGQKDSKGWTTGDTAKLLNVSSTNLYRQIRFANFLKDNPAYRKEVERLPLNAAIRKVDMIKAAEKNKRLVEQGDIKVDSSLRLGDARVLIKDIPDESVDLLLTDVPYGIADVSEALRGKKVHSSSSYKGLISESDNLTKEKVIDILTTLLPEIRRVLKPSSHFYIFHSFAIYSNLFNILIDNNFLPFDVPIIWDKGKTTNAFRGYEFMACYEPIMYGHIPPKEKMFALGGKLIVQNQVVKVNSRLHPFEKPLDLLSNFIRQSTKMGDVILDPFAGSGATLIAGMRLERTCIGFEVNERNYNLALARLDEEKKGKII